jgi:hypothetical protein
MHFPRPSIGATKLGSCTAVGRDAASRMWNSLPWIGQIGSITDACWHPSGIFRRWKPGNVTKPRWINQPWQRNLSKQPPGNSERFKTDLTTKSFVLPGKLTVLGRDYIRITVRGCPFVKGRKADPKIIRNLGPRKPAGQVYPHRVFTKLIGPACALTSSPQLHNI